MTERSIVEILAALGVVWGMGLMSLFTSTSRREWVRAFAVLASCGALALSAVSRFHGRNELDVFAWALAATAIVAVWPRRQPSNLEEGGNRTSQSASSQGLS